MRTANQDLSKISVSDEEKKRKCEILFAQRRLQQDLPEIKDVYGSELIIPDPNNIFEFIVKITPETGIWAKRTFSFKFMIPENFPYIRPRLQCLTKLWHPNIDVDGAVCMSIIRLQYTASTPIASIVAGLHYLFINPDPEDPLNKDAAKMYIEDHKKFIRTAEEYMNMYCR